MDLNSDEEFYHGTIKGAICFLELLVQGGLTWHYNFNSFLKKKEKEFKKLIG